MIAKDSLNFVFENDILKYESFLNGFTDSLFDQFDAKSDELNLILKIEDLINGKEVNFTESRAAWHPKYRKDFNINIPLPEISLNCKNIIVLGIGGSFEGPKLLIESLHDSDSDINCIFITGSDPFEFEDKVRNLMPKETVFIVSSKSFTTDETLETLEKAIEWSGDMNNFIAITSNKEAALKHNIKNTIKFDKEIGGRYSIWSKIHIPAAFGSKSKFNARDFLRGGHQADLDLQNNKDYLKFIKILSFSDIWLNNSKGKNSRVVLSYSWKLRSFADYVQQLEMESLGKQPDINSEYKKTGQIIFGGYGPRAQHSFFQLLHQGTQDVCVDIIVNKEDKESLAYAQAVTQSELLSQGANDLNNHEKINGNVPTNLFFINNSDSYDLGYLLATWEHRTFITASMLGINPFDQFGVSAGKIYTNKYLSDTD